jgi:DNA-binding HxlR family transcriptional regulator
MISIKYNVTSEHCPSRNVLVVISDKWSILVIKLLSQKTWRFGELRREIGGISQKMLSQTLKILEQYGFVIRQAYPVLPLKVEYSLTPLGKELSLIINSITLWTEQNMEEILNHEKNYIKNKEAEMLSIIHSK